MPKKKEAAIVGIRPHAWWETLTLKPIVVYKSTVHHGSKISNYIGMTENSFKTRYTQHRSSLKHSKNRTQSYRA